MKNKTFTIISAIVLLALFSCSKQENMSNEKAQKMNDGKVYTIVAQFDAQENGSKTTIDPNKHNATAWVLNDKIWLHNGTTDGEGEVTQIQDGKAVITTSLDISTGTLYAVYPSPEGYDYQTPADCPYSIVDGKIQIVIPTAQDGVFAKAHICAAIMKDKKLTFKNAITLMKVTGIKAGSGINQFVFPGAGGTITFNPALAEKDKNTGISVSERTDVTVTPAGAGPYYVAVAPTTEYPMNGIIANYNKDTKGEYSKRANKLTPLLRSRVYNLGEAPGTSLPYDALPGEFTVDAQGHKVCFSKGNLYCHRSSSTSQDWTFGFYDKQYGINCNFFKTGVGSGFTTSKDDLEIDLFCAGYDPEKSINPVDQTNHATTIEAYKDWGVALDDMKWRSLTTDEWLYLFRENNYTTLALMYKDSNGRDQTIKGYIIFPDGADKSQWQGLTLNKTLLGGGIGATMTVNEFELNYESKGVVFFPAVGNRNGDSWRTANYNAMYSAQSYNLGPDFHNITLPNTKNAGNTQGYSVRLVTNIGW